MSISGSSMLSLVNNNTGGTDSNVLKVGNNGGTASSTFSGTWNIVSYGLTTNGANVLGMSSGLGVSTVALSTGNNGTNTNVASTFNMNAASNSQQIAGLISNSAGSGIVNLGTNTLTFNNTTSSDVYSGTIAATAGNLVMNGTGTQSLAGVESYTGTTTVSGGTLAVSGTGSINSSTLITINGSTAKFLQTSSTASTPSITLTQGKLDGTGTVGAVTVGAGTGGIVQNGNGTATALTVKSLTYSGAGTANLTVAGGATTGPALIVTNVLTNSVGPVALDVTPLSAWNNGTTYNLIQYGSFTGSLANFTTAGTISGLTPRQNATLGTAGNDITLTITGDTPKWTGLDSTNWQVGSTGGSGNWKLISAGTATSYIQGDAVSFDDSATGEATPGVVTINGASVSPTSTTFSNSSINYTVSSTGGFGIAAGSLTKNGSATVTLSTANGYSGATAVNSGTLRINGSLAAGSAVSVGGASAGGASGTPTLAGSGTINGSVTVFGAGSGNIAGHLAPSGFTGSSGTTLNLTGALTLNAGSALDFNLSNSTSAGNDLVSVTGSGAVNYGTGGVLNINAYSGNALALGTYTLISDASSATPTGGTGWTVGTNHDTNSSLRSYAISVIGKNLDLTVSVPLTWSGQNGSAWDTSSTNWFNLAFSSATFFNGASAFFGDTQYAGGPAVTNKNITMGVVGGVSPASVVFNNTSTPLTGVAYTITSNDSGAVGITGTTGITVAGTGIVSLVGTNTYTGMTQLNAGTLVIGNNNAIGSASGTIAPLTFNGGTLQYAAGSSSTDLSGRLITFQSGAKIDLNGNNVTYANAIGNNGTGGLTLVDSGAPTTLTLGGANTFGNTTSTGATNIAILGGTLSISSGPNLGVAPTVVQPASILINGGTLKDTVGTAANATGVTTLSTNRGITLGSSSGTLDITGITFTSNGNQLASETAFVYNGLITGTGGLTVLGSGGAQAPNSATTAAQSIVDLGLAATYQGNTTINDAIVQVNSGTAGANNGAAINNVLPATTLNLINGGTFNMDSASSNLTVAGLTGDTSGRLATSNTGSAVVLTINGSGTYAFPGIIGAAETVGKTGADTTLSLVLSGSGTQILTGTNTYAAGTTLKSGTLGINNVHAIGTGTLILNGGTIDNTGTVTNSVTLSTNNIQTWGPAVAASTSGFTYGGTGSLNLGTGAVTISGDTSTPFTETITANLVNPGSALTIGGPISLATTVTTANTLAIAGPGTVLLGGAISNGTGAGASLALTMSGTGTLNLSGANTYTGTTLINSGTLAVSGSGSVNNSSGITINGNGAVLLQNSSVASTPAITLTQGTVTGSGTVGATTVGAGTGGIVGNGNGTLGNSSALTLSSLTFNGAATMNLNQAGGSATTSPSLIVNGAEQFRRSGDGQCEHANHWLDQRRHLRSGSIRHVSRWLCCRKL